MVFHLLLVVLALWPALADEGTLRVKTDVPEVEVLLDGASIGKTPLTLPAVAVGVHRLTFVKPGFEEQEQQVQIQPAATAKLFVLMKPLPAPALKLPAQFYAIHQHSAGTACSGILTVTQEAIEYRSHDGHDVFHIPIVEVRSLSRSLGAAWWTGKPLKTGSALSACRIEVPGRSFGFYAYEENPELAGTPAEHRVPVEDRIAKTKELYDLVYRLWSEMLSEREQRNQAPK